jgi:hypothetical protein
VVKGGAMRFFVPLNQEKNIRVISDYYARCVALLSLPKGTVLYWYGNFEEKHLAACLHKDCSGDVFDENDYFIYTLVLWSFFSGINPNKITLVAGSHWDNYLNENRFYFQFKGHDFYVISDKTASLSVIQEKIAKTQSQIDGIERKLKDGNFLEKAPPETIENTKKKLDELKLELQFWVYNTGLQSKKDDFVKLLKECDLA